VKCAARTYLITGGAGFIGSNFVHFLAQREPHCRIRVFDKLSYSGSLASLEPFTASRNFAFIEGDIADARAVGNALDGVNVVVNFAAEVAVDRAIVNADAFLRTGVLGVHALLEGARLCNSLQRFIQISTDEVYGSVGDGDCHESAPLAPRNPYAAAKASGEMLARSYFDTYGLPVNVTRAANTYGPRAHPEKVIPLFITNLIDGKPVPIFGDGRQVRDWLYVDDHCEAIYTVLRSGAPGETYNIGAGQSSTNLELTRRILAAMDLDARLIRFVADRPGHDRRYSVQCGKLARLGWTPQVPLDDGLERTITWYRRNEAWWRPLKARLDRRYEVGFWGEQTCAV
jgi:dTDP-glucose 4,6-dehydratase